MIKIENPKDNFICLVIKGKIQSGDFQEITSRFKEITDKYDKIKLLIIATQFQGWESINAFKEHYAFVRSHQKYIERIGFVYKRLWQRMILAIVKCFVTPEVKAFAEQDKNLAWRWVGEFKQKKWVKLD